MNRVGDVEESLHMEGFLFTFKFKFHVLGFCNASLNGLYISLY